MCASCGCKQPNDDYGVPANITADEITAAAAAASAAQGKPVTVVDVAANITAWAAAQSDEPSNAGD